jgi:nucleoid DNA-binding protein
MAVKKSAKKAKPSKVIARPAKGKVSKSKPIASKAKVVVKKPAVKALGKITKPFTKSELYGAIATSTELNRKQVTAVFEKLGEIIALHLKKDGPEKFMLPGMLKVVVKKIPARPAREGKNPFTGETMMFKAKPASKKVKVVALGSLKAMCL